MNGTVEKLRKAKRSLRSANLRVKTSKLGKKVELPKTSGYKKLNLPDTRSSKGVVLPDTSKTRKPDSITPEQKEDFDKKTANTNKSIDGVMKKHFFKNLKEDVKKKQSKSSGK